MPAPDDGPMIAAHDPFKILMIEDNEDDVALIVEYASQLGDDVVLNRAPDLKSGLREIENWAPDVVLLDLHLPDSQGAATIRSVCDACRDTGSPLVFVLTATDDGDTAREAVEDCASGVLLKGDITPKSLMRTLDLAVRRQGAARLREIEERGARGPGDVVAAKKIGARAERIVAASDTGDHATLVGGLSMSSYANRVLSDAVAVNVQRVDEFAKQNRVAINGHSKQLGQLMTAQQQHAVQLNRFEHKLSGQSHKVDELCELVKNMHRLFVGDGEKEGLTTRVATIEGRQRTQRQIDKNRSDYWWGVGSGILPTAILAIGALIWKIIVAYYQTHPGP